MTKMTRRTTWLIVTSFLFISSAVLARELNAPLPDGTYGVSGGGHSGDAQVSGDGYLVQFISDGTGIGSWNAFWDINEENYNSWPIGGDFTLIVEQITGGLHHNCWEIQRNSGTIEIIEFHDHSACAYQH